jgi:hypothetical protein
MTGPGRPGGATRSPAVQAQHQRVWLLWSVMGKRSYVDLAAATGYSYDHVREIIREQILLQAEEEDVVEYRRQLWADLEEVKLTLAPALFPRSLPDGTPLPEGIGVIPADKDAAATFLKFCHEQALLVGAHAPKQTTTTHKVEENAQADQFANDLTEWMDLADKLGMSGYGSGREELSHEDAESVLDADIVPTPRPPLLEQVEEAASKTNGHTPSAPINL